MSGTGSWCRSITSEMCAVMYYSEHLSDFFNSDWICESAMDISLIISVISVFLCYSCDCDFTAFRNRCIGVVQRTLSDIGCLIVTLVKLQVFRVSSG